MATAKSRFRQKFRVEITFVEETLFKDQKLIVPKSLKTEMLAIVHESLLGINKCKSRARFSLFWTGMVSEIEQTVIKCTVCAQNQRANVKIIDTWNNSRQTMVTCFHKYHGIEQQTLSCHS